MAGGDAGDLKDAHRWWPAGAGGRNSGESEEKMVASGGCRDITCEIVAMPNVPTIVRATIRGGERWAREGGVFLDRSTTSNCD